MKRAVVLLAMAACGGSQPAELHPTRGPIGSAAVEARHTPPPLAPAPKLFEGDITIKDDTTPHGRIVIG